VGHTAAVSDDVEPRMVGLEVVIEPDLHVVELDLHAIEKGVIVGCTRRDLIEGVDHLRDPVQDPLGQDETEVARRRLQGRPHSALLDAGGVAPAASLHVSEALHDDPAAQHVGQAGDALPVAVAVFEGLRKMLRYQQGKIRVLRLSRGILEAVAVHCDDPVRVFVDHDPVGIHAEGPDTVLVFLGAVDDLALVQLVCQVGEDNGR